MLRLRTTLVEADRVRTLRFRLDVPKDARRSGFLQVEGGGSIWDSAIYQAETPAQLEEKFDLEYHFKHVDTIFARVFG